MIIAHNMKSKRCSVPKKKQTSAISISAPIGGKYRARYNFTQLNYPHS